MRPLLLVGGLVSCCCFLATVQGDEVQLRADWKPGAAGLPDDITTSISHADPDPRGPKQMLVLVDDKGAAAVRFLEGRRTAKICWRKYEFRYQSFDGKITDSGVGELYEQRDASGTLGGNVNITIRGLSAGWSQANDHCCWILFSPEKIGVHAVNADLFAPQVRKIPISGEIITTPPLDLKRFQRK